jgi:hypothetical protein
MHAGIIERFINFGITLNSVLSIIALSREKRLSNAVAA